VQGNCLDFHVCFSQFMATPSALWNEPNPINFLVEDEQICTPGY
jgi:hypothetical protein